MKSPQRGTYDRKNDRAFGAYRHPAAECLGRRRTQRVYRRDRLSRRDAALAARLLYGVVQNCMLLDSYLAQAVSSPLAKLQPVVLDILRLGAYQILFLDKIPVSAAVNEAVEQTKTYANKRAAGLVNGSLRTLAPQKGRTGPAA